MSLFFLNKLEARPFKAWEVFFMQTKYYMKLFELFVSLLFYVRINILFHYALYNVRF